MATQALKAWHQGPQQHGSNLATKLVTMAVRWSSAVFRLKIFEDSAQLGETMILNLNLDFLVPRLVKGETRKR